jgi:predicted DNA-binding protein (UPF0251 family)
MRFARIFASLALVLLSLLLGACQTAGQVAADTTRTPQQVVDELLDADRGFSEHANIEGLSAALGAMFADDVMMPTPEGKFAQGRAEALAAVAANLDNVGAHATWAPVRGGISADGLHGLTFGYMTVTRADGGTVPAKYLAYWIRQEAGWRVAVYKHRRRAEGEPTLLTMAPALPPRLRQVNTNAEEVEACRASLDAAERAFSDAAQKLGLGQAFVQYGSIDAINMGGGASASFVVGADAIGHLIGEGLPENTSPVTWAPDRVLIASSGDFGITIGMLTLNAPAENGEPAKPIPFFTIWRRPTLSEPWRYLAE